MMKIVRCLESEKMCSIHLLSGEECQQHASVDTTRLVITTNHRQIIVETVPGNAPMIFVDGEKLVVDEAV